MMTDARWSAATSATPGGAQNRRARLQRAGQGCAAALVAGAAVALSTGPALAAAPSQSSVPPSQWGEPLPVVEDSLPFISRGSSGQTTFGIKGTEATPTEVKGLTMRLYAPEHTWLPKDAKPLPLDGAPGGWECNVTLGMEPATDEQGGDRMTCTTDYAGPLPAAGAQWRWQVNCRIPVYDDAMVPVYKRMPPEWDKSTNGWATIQAHSADGSGSAWSSSMSMGVRTATAQPAQPAPAPAAPGLTDLTGTLGLLGSLLHH